MMQKGKISNGVKDRKSYIVALECLGIGVLLVLLCSCVSFNIGDWPSRFVYPHNAPPANWCGSVGAFCAYYLLYYIGPGVLVVFISSICFLIAKLSHRPIDQMAFRAIGLLLVTAVVSITFYCICPHRFFEFPMGSGGVLGVEVAHILRSNFASVGTALLMSALWVAGLLLLADTFILTLAGFLGFAARKTVGLFIPARSAARSHPKALGQIWQKLSSKSVAGASTSTAGVEVKPEHVDARPSGQLQENTPTAHSRQEPPARSIDEYELPPMELLAEPEYSFAAVQEKVVKAKSSAVEKLLSEFSINARVAAADTGPVVTMFELELGAGVKVSQISTLSNDIARALGVGAVRVVAPLPGKHTIGIEVPNSEKERVRMKSMIELAGDRPSRMQIPLFLGKDSSAEAMVSDLTTMPHLLIAGTTGSGKSVCINSIIVGIMLTKRPDEVKLILIDPKMVEMTAFNTIPHLMCPIVTETQMAVQVLEWATVKMDERYALLAEARVKNVVEYNSLGEEEIARRFSPSSAEEEAKIPKRLPYIVIIIDELADLMMTSPKEIETYVVRLAQKSRAVGIHLVIATQRPQATVVTGLIKSNMPTRIGFRVAARLDSRIVLDQNGAETLLGEGDMLFLKPGTSDLARAQGTFVDDAEIKRIVKYLKECGEPQFHPELTGLKKVDTSEIVKDELFNEAVRIILETQRGSVSLLQRRLNVGYARASRIIETMAAIGVLGEYKGSQAREVLMTLEEYEKVREQMDTEAEHQGQEDSSEDAYVDEGQSGYVSSDKFERE